ncbi:MAG: hypothetical protein ACO1N7_01440 [Sphingobacteriaceae bacterium]
MKRVDFFKALSVGILMGMLPLMVSAKKSLSADGMALDNLNLKKAFLTIDSIPKAKTQDDKNKDSKKKPEAKKGEDKTPKTVEIDKKKPKIKEVPKARPKVRPGVVDKVKVKRPPVKIKPGRGH